MSNLGDKQWVSGVSLDPDDRWVNCSLNKLPSVDNEIKPKSVIISDITLRSGTNTPGVRVNSDAKMEIAQRLDEIGVKEAEVGYPNSEPDCDFVKMLKKTSCKLKVGFHLLLGMGTYKENIDKAVEAGVDIVNIVAGAVPVSGRRLETAELMDSIGETASYSKKQGILVSVGGLFHDMDSVQQLVTVSADVGADRICIYDGRGWFTPQTISFLVKYVRGISKGSTKVTVHCHNDFGLATINTLEAIKSGAYGVDVTVNGTGHRCGNASFEQVVIAAEVLYGIQTGIDLSKLPDLCRLVEELYDVPIASNSPHVGENMYRHGGAHLMGCVRGEWYEWENIKPETLGYDHQSFFWGSTVHPGRDGPINSKVALMGLSASDQELDVIYERLQDVISHKKFATDEEMAQIIRDSLGRR